MELSVVDHTADLPGLREKWGELEAADPAAVAGSWRFLCAWCRQRLNGDSVHVVLLHEGSQCVGLAPMMVTTRRMGPVRVPTLTYMTRNGYVPGPRLLAFPEARPEVAERLVEHVLERDRAWRAVRLINIIPGGPLDRVLGQRLGHGLCAHYGAEEGSATIPLPGKWEDLLSSFRRDRRQAIVNRAERLAASHRVESLALTEPGEIAPALEECFAVASRSWQGRAGTSIASTPESRRFYRDLLADYGRKGQARIQLLRVDGKAAAFEIALAYHGCHYALKIGFDQALREFGIGVLAQADAFRGAMEAGDREVELFYPIDDGKRPWNAVSRPRRQMTIFNGCFSRYLLEMAHRGRDMARS